MSQHDAPTPPTDPRDDACAVCPHPWADHDALGVRFCTATMVSANPRGCICRTVPVAA